MDKNRYSADMGGSATILSIGLIFIGLGGAILAVDLPYYFATQNQLQTTVDAAALAGAMQLPNGQSQAESAALELARENPVAQQILTSHDLTFSSSQSKFTVSGQVKAPTIIAKLFCILSGKSSGIKLEDDSSIRAGSNDSASCDTMTVAATSSAAPAARDTILVIDTSSSMDDLGNGRPLKDIKTAANNFIDIIAALNNESIDRLGLVSFNQSAIKQIGLTSQIQSPTFTAVKNKVNGLTLFNGIGWNTNYETGLKVALDELETNGRKNAQKTIIFMTDGMPNLPAPDSYYLYSQNEPYLKCIDPVNNSTQVKTLCTKNKQGQKVCPVLPSSTIPDSMISSSATQCTVTYVDAMKDKTNSQTDRAKKLDVTINTISLYDPNNEDNAQSIFRRLLKQPKWRPDQLDYMSSTTKGQAYEAANYDAAKIKTIYQSIAQDIHVRLTN